MNIIETMRISSILHTGSMFYGNMGDYDKATTELFPVAAYLLFTPDIHLQMKFTQVSDLLVFNTRLKSFLNLIFTQCLL